MPHRPSRRIGIVQGQCWLPLILVFAALVYLRGWLHLRSTSLGRVQAGAPPVF